MGTTDRLRHALWLRNHDVHRQPLSTYLPSVRLTDSPPSLLQGTGKIKQGRGVPVSCDSRDVPIFSFQSIRNARGNPLKVRVLGSGAGGGFPQWNCNCPMCDGFRKGSMRASARTQSSITVSGDDENWLLFNASPDVLQQLRSFPALQPARALRDTAIRAIVLIDAQIDHTTGLYMLREHRQPHELWCTDLVREDLTSGNPLFKVLEPLQRTQLARHSARRPRLRDPGHRRPALHRAAADLQCAALLAASRQPAARRQHRRHHHRYPQRQEAVLRAGPRPDGRARLGGDAGGRLRAGGRHAVDRRRNDPPRRLEEDLARHGPPAAERSRTA